MRVCLILLHFYQQFSTLWLLGASGMHRHSFRMHQQKNTGLHTYHCSDATATLLIRNRVISRDFCAEIHSARQPISPQPIVVVDNGSAFFLVPNLFYSSTTLFSSTRITLFELNVPRVEF